MARTLLLLIAISQILAVHGFYSNGDVTVLTPSNFDTKTRSGIWIVEFYAPWCGHCKALTPEWEKTATALKGIVGVGAVDADAHKSLGQQYGIKGFPTIKLIYAGSDGKLKSVDYQGGRTAKDIVQWATQQAQKVALGRLGVKSSGGSSGGSSSGNNSGGGSGFYTGTNVVELTDSSFNNQVRDADDMWFVEFYAPWCGHCKQLKPTWLELATALDDKVKVGAIDCTANEQTCAEFGVRGYPTIKFFGANKDRPEAYEGGRDLESLTAYATDRWSRDQPPPEVRELYDQVVWEEHCIGHEENKDLKLKGIKPKQLCLVAFLPHILDSKADGRNAYLDMLKSIAASYKGKMWSWFWVEGVAQPNLEANVQVGGYGYPAFVAVNPSKAKYATLRGGFEAQALKEFMDNVRSGRERVMDIEGELATIEERPSWDGLDGAEYVEEEFSLEDLGLGGADDAEL